MAKKGQVFRKYSPEFKLYVILDMRENHLGYNETIRKYNLPGFHLPQKWKRQLFVRRIREFGRLSF